MKKNEIVLFETEDKAVRLEVPIESETVWLTQDQMSELFDTARSSIAYHIGNILTMYFQTVKLIKITTRKKCVLKVLSS